MKDQYGQAVPADLVVIPAFNLLNDAEVALIDRLDWYECKGILLVPENEAGGDDPRDVGLQVDQDGNLTAEVKKVDRILHRYNQQDGFYHA